MAGTRRHPDFQVGGDTFADRIGPPEEFDAALGRIVLGFSYLEDSVRNVVTLLLGCDLQTGSTVCAELGFRQKLDIMGSLIWLRFQKTPADADLESEVRDILAICRRSEELRNQHLHSRYSRRARAKVSAKANHGFRIDVQPTNPDILLDVADYITNAAVVVEELPLLLGLADTAGGTGDRVEYRRDGKIVATFRFGE